MAVNSYDHYSKSGSSNSNNGVSSVSYSDGMSDGGQSKLIRESAVSAYNASDIESSNYTSLLHSHNQFRRNEIDLYNKTYRFGLFNPYGAVTTSREFLFFTKPDLNILARDDNTGSLTGGLNSNLASSPFWVDLYQSRLRTIKALQNSANQLDYPDPFNHLLQNQVISTLEVPSLDAEMTDTATNMFGVGFSYRGSSESGDDGQEFSLEFKDDRWLDVYYFFKTYEEYETLKHHGTIRPWRRYIEQKVIHDQFAIYKFIVDEDMETLLYYGKYYGVTPKSLPRDVFSNTNFDTGLSYTINFKAAFYEDMRPDIIADFNALSLPYYNTQPYQIDVHNTILDRVDNRPAKAAYIEKVQSNISPNGFVYKLRWRGSDKV